MAEKMTKIESLSAIRVFLMEHDAPDFMVDFAQHEVDLLVNRAEKRKPSISKATAENAKIREQLFDLIAEAESPVTSADLAEISGMSVNKVAGLLRDLVKENRINKSVDKKKSFYSIKAGD